MSQDKLSPTEAAEVAAVTATAIRSWCRDFGIGERFGGRWRVDSAKLHSLLSTKELRQCARVRKRLRRIASNIRAMCDASQPFSIDPACTAELEVLRQLANRLTALANRFEVVEQAARACHVRP